MEKRSARSNFGGRGWILTIYAFLIFFSASCPALIFNATVPHFDAVLGVDNVKQHLKQKIYKTIIPRNVRLAEAPSHGLPIILYDPRSAGAESYRKLAKEVIAYTVEK